MKQARSDFFSALLGCAAVAKKTKKKRRREGLGETPVRRGAAFPPPLDDPPPESDRGASPLARWGLLAGAILVVGGGVWWSRREPSSPPAGPSAVAEGPRAPLWRQDCAIPVTSEDPALGPKDAPVTVVVFSDFECPYCSKVEPALRGLREEYGDKVRIVWKDLPLPMHRAAIPAAVAARTVFRLKGADAFWRVHDQVFEHQRELSDSFLRGLAKDEGVTGADLERFRATSLAIVRESSDLAEKLGIQGTPNMVVNGELVSGALPLEAFRAVVDRQLARADEALARGAAKDAVYAALVGPTWKKPKEPEQEEQGPHLDPAKVYVVPVGTSPSEGPADALVTAVVFSEFQCPFCKQFEPTVRRLRQEYAKDVRVVFKHQPLGFHKRALPAAVLSMEAFAQKGAKGFWEAHDALFASQPKLEDADLEGIAVKLKLDEAKVRACLEKSCHADTVKADAALGSSLGVDGTPTTFVNGRPLVGAIDWPQVEALVKEELEKAKKRVESGTPAAKLYETILREAGGAPEPKDEKKPEGKKPDGKKPQKEPDGKKPDGKKPQKEPAR